jgi:nucleotide-binding universal stress UspA family protein
MFKKIVVGTDGSNTARAAVDHAIGIAEATGARVYVIAAFKSATSPFEGSSIELGRRVLDEVKEEYAARGVTMLTDVREGTPADAIIGAAEEEDADLIVVGNVGMGQDPRFRGGSVPNAISHHAPCNVLIVHTSDA